VMGFSRHQQMHAERTFGSCCWVLGARTSLVSILVIGPHHAVATRASEELRSGPAGARGLAGHHRQLEFGLGFCVLVAISPRRARQVGGACSAGYARPAPALLRHEYCADPRRSLPPSG
jgi:hypothetical protein